MFHELSINYAFLLGSSNVYYIVLSCSEATEEYQREIKDLTETILGLMHRSMGLTFSAILPFLTYGRICPYFDGQ